MSDALHPDDLHVHLPVLPENKNVTSEQEIKDCWRTNMLSAASEARLLVILPAQGATFVRMREHLSLAEGACRQMAHWREDARWLYLAPKMEQLHQMTRLMIVSHYASPLFTILAHLLEKLVSAADLLENKKTGRVGMILPEPLRHDRTEGRAVQVQNPVELAHEAIKVRRGNLADEAT